MDITTYPATGVASSSVALRAALVLAAVDEATSPSPPRSRKRSRRSSLESVIVVQQPGISLCGGFGAVGSALDDLTVTMSDEHGITTNHLHRHHRWDHDDTLPTDQACPSTKVPRVSVDRSSPSIVLCPFRTPPLSPGSSMNSPPMPSLASPLHEAASPMSAAPTLSNPSSSPSTPPHSPCVERILDAISSSSSSPHHHSLSCGPLLLPASASRGAAAPADGAGGGTTLGGMRSRWLKTLSMPTFQLALPDDQATNVDSNLGSLVVPLSLGGAPSHEQVKRSPNTTSRSLTPPPFGSPSSSSSSSSTALLQPFSFSRSFDASADGIQSSGSMFGVSAHQGTRASMQDSFTCLPQSQTFIVADGHGRSGHIVSALVTGMLPNLFQSALTSSSTSTATASTNQSRSHSIGSAYLTAFEAMDAHLLKHTSGGGSTAVMLHLSTDALTHERALHLAHVGDSRAVLSTSRQARALTVDHKPDLPEEKAAILARGGSVTQSRKQLRLDQQLHLNPQLRLDRPMPPATPRRNAHSTSFSAAFSSAVAPSAVASSSPTGSSLPSTSTSASSQWRVEGLLNLSRSLGDAHLKAYISGVPSVGRHILTETDEFVILATDGVWNVFSDQEAVDLIHEFMSTQQQAQTTAKHIHSLAARAADHLTTTALQRGSLDNVLAIVLLLQQPQR